MDLIKIYKQNEILENYVNIYFDDEKEPTLQHNVKYKILDIIGNGVYGVVYKAYCLDSSCVVALKQTYQKNARIFKEVEIMKKLRHPNIVKLKHAFYTTTSNGGIYVHMIMEYGNTDLATSLYYISIENSAEHVNTFYEPTANQEGYAQNGNPSILRDDSLDDTNLASGTENRLGTSQLDCPRGASGVLKNAVSNFNINALQESISHICPCHNISEYIKKSFLNENQIKIYLYQLIRATLYLHTLCITHRDIKPQNVLIFVNKQTSSNGVGGVKNEEKKKCLVCIQNSFKVKYIMNRRRRGKGRSGGSGGSGGSVRSSRSSRSGRSNLSEAQGAGEATLDQSLQEGDPTPNGITHQASRNPSPRGSLNSANNAKEEGSQNEEGSSHQGGGEETHSGGSHHGMETTPCGITKRRAQRCHSRYSRSGTPVSIKCVMNSLSKKDMRLKRSASMTQLFKDNHDMCKESSKENCSSVSANNLKAESREDKSDEQVGSPNWCREKSAVVDAEKDNVNCNASEKGGVPPPQESSSSISSTEGDILSRLEVNSAHTEEEISLERIYMNSITYKYIKLCDFNTSIKLKENYKYFSYVCSRYYRAPELLFGSNYYSQAIDTWSIGCVMGELILGKPLFLGNCASDQLVEIIKILGTPNDEDFLSFKSGHKNVKLPQVKPITLKKLIKNQSSQESIDLLGKLLQFNPQKRIKLCNALLHTYFDDIRNLSAFKDERNGGSTFQLPYITNCFNFTKEELLHFTVEERKILVPLEVRRRKLDEVMQYIDMTLESFDQMYPNKVHLAC
ncbi:CMGC/GSK protein kinase [Plasmodium coatneyi]|uniref:CMGC/GSK protein kinase n=1 Tax=Plasmodium coatneyi TaxID=208452 RepID=A0A1B1DW00_9APIC|nr:CMGC/GSK protein kinase [Plasmodium coatneyi]ANQ06755.1 CMGC/GSK protein kinase [Plasmodium coatneyi]